MKKLLLFLVPFIVVPAAFAMTVNVPVTSGTYRPCLVDYPGYYYIGWSGPCPFEQVIQPDYTVLPPGDPESVTLSWDGNGGSTLLQFSKIPGGVPWWQPITTTEELKTDVQNTLGVTDITSQFSDLRNGGKGILVYNPGGSIIMNNQDWRMEAEYPNLTPTPTPSGTSVIVPVVSGTGRTCLGDYPGYNNIGVDGPCSLVQLVQPNYDTLPSGTPSDVIIRWDHSATAQVPLYMMQTGTINWGTPFPGGPVFLSAKSTTGEAHIRPSLFANMKLNESGIRIDNAAGSIPMDRFGWSIEAIYPAPVTISASPATGNVSVGSSFDVDVVLDSGTTPFNAAQATVTVSDKLTISGLHTPASDACNFQYTVTPTKENPSFAGAIFAAGKTHCKVYTLTLTPNAVGNGTVSFPSRSMKTYENAREMNPAEEQGTYTIGTGPTPTPTPNPTGGFAVTSYPLDAYADTVTVSGTRDADITHVTVNGTETGVTLTENGWTANVTLSTLGPIPFLLIARRNDGTGPGSISISINKHTVADLNGDGVINLADASLFAVDWGKTSNFTYLSDLNVDDNGHWIGDGVVDLTDFSILARLIQL